MTEKNNHEKRPSFPQKDAFNSDEEKSAIPRRQFIKIGAATLAVSLVGGGLLKFLLLRPKKFGSVKASPERPNKNPAFSFKKHADGTLACATRLPEGKVLKHELNSVGAELYLACDGEHTREEIVRQAASTLGKGPTEFAPEAKAFLAELERQHLIVTTGKVNLFYNKVVRYERT